MLNFITQKNLKASKTAHCLLNVLTGFHKVLSECPQPRSQLLLARFVLPLDLTHALCLPLKPWLMSATVWLFHSGILACSACRITPLLAPSAPPPPVPIVEVKHQLCSDSYIPHKSMLGTRHRGESQEDTTSPHVCLHATSNPVRETDT